MANKKWVGVLAGTVLAGLGVYGAYRLLKPKPTTAELKGLVATSYWSGERAFSGVPGARIPVAEGQAFGGTLQFEHIGLGGKVKVGFNCLCGSTRVWAGPVDVNIPDETDWTTHTVNVSGTYHSSGLAHCALVGTQKVIMDQSGTVLLADDDAECYHNISHGECDFMVVEKYRVDNVGAERLASLPGGLLPIADGATFGATVRFRHRYLGGRYTIESNLVVGSVNEPARAAVDLPNAWDWTEYTVDVWSVAPFDRHSLEHCVRVGTLNRVIDAGGNVLKENSDAACYHVVTKTEFRNLVVIQYRSARAVGGPGARVPIANGDSFAAFVSFEYRYLGGPIRCDVSLYVEGVYERARADFTVPTIKDWVAGTVTVHSLAPYDSRGLPHCRLIGCLKELWGPGGAYLSDSDANCYHNILAQFRNLTAQGYWSERP